MTGEGRREEFLSHGTGTVFGIWTPLQASSRPWVIHIWFICLGREEILWGLGCYFSTTNCLGTIFMSFGQFLAFSSGFSYHLILKLGGNIKPRKIHSNPKHKSGRVK
jgi:hypothetical protein